MTEDEWIAEITDALSTSDRGHEHYFGKQNREDLSVILRRLRASVLAEVRGRVIDLDDIYTGSKVERILRDLEHFPKV